MGLKERKQRTEMLIGEEGIKKLKDARVLIFGVGGVGGFVCEALARAGIGAIDIVDNDVVSESNINRQIIANYRTLNRYKVDVMEERIKSINPDLRVTSYKCFYLPDDEESAGCFDFNDFDYIVDAIDTTSAKIDIISRAKECDVPVISSMGTGNKMDNTRFKITDIEKTSVCPLAKVIRKELRKRGIKKVDVLFSDEEPKKNGQMVPSSISYVPATAGLLIGGYVIRKILGAE